MEHLTSSIEFQMALLLFVSLGGYLLAMATNQSSSIGSIIAGLIIGPSVLGLVTYTDFVQSIAHLGAIILLFVIGMEFKTRDIFNFRYGVIALAGVIVPWLGGYFLAKAFHYTHINAVFIGTALTATSIAITAQVLREMGKLQSEAAKAIIGAAVIDDILGLLALSLSEELVQGNLTWSVVAGPLISATLFLIIGIYTGQQFLRPFVERIDRTPFAEKYPEFIFILVMTIAFFYSMIAEMIHLSAIVGAFLAGITFEGVHLKHSKSFKEGAEYLYIIFGAIFFVSLGILVNINVMTPAVVIFLIVLTLVGVLTKVLGCGLPARWMGMSWRDSAVIGFGMSPRGEVAMIVGLIGLNQKIITHEIYAAIIFMSLLTTIITPVVLRNWLYK